MYSSCTILSGVYYCLYHNIHHIHKETDRSSGKYHLNLKEHPMVLLNLSVGTGLTVDYAFYTLLRNYSTCETY